MKEILKNKAVLCFGGEDYWYHNHGHIDFQICKQFAAHTQVLYINSLVMQKPVLKRRGGFFSKLKRKFKSMTKGLRKTEIGFWVYSPYSLPLHHIPWARKLNYLLLRLQLSIVLKKLKFKNYITWVACPPACDIAEKIKTDKLVYQRTDVYELYPNVDRSLISSFDIQLKKNADMTVFVNKKLYTEEQPQCKKALYLDHGVDFALFANAHKDDFVPADIANIPKPILGYYGAVNNKNTTDVGLICLIADLMPKMSVVVIGKVVSGKSLLEKHKNIYLLGQKPYRLIPHYGKCFDVAFMPWRQNKWIQHCNPVKLKEYLALGKPVVTTHFTEIDSYKDIVYIASSPTSFAVSAKLAFIQDSPEKIRARRERVRLSTWEHKAVTVIETLYGLPLSIENVQSTNDINENIIENETEKQKKEIKSMPGSISRGHLTQLLQTESLWQGHDVFCITTSDIVKGSLEHFGPTYILAECNRNNPFKLTMNFMRCLKLFFRHRPDLVVSTGAAVGCLACLTAKMFGAKVIWIDSITNVNKLSLSGKIIRPVANLFLVQWSDLQRKYPKVEYAGTVI